MKTPYYETNVTIGGSSQTQKFDAFPSTMNVRQSGRLRVLCYDENNYEYEITNLAGTDLKAKPYGTSEVEVTLGTGSVKYTPEIFTITSNSDPSTGGTFTITVAGETTSAIAYNATAATIQTALEALTSRSSGDFEVKQIAGLNLGEASASVRIELSGGFALTARSSIDTGSLTGGTAHSLTTNRTQSTLQNMYEVTWVKDKIPSGWASYSETFGSDSGTLIIWVELDETGTEDFYPLGQRINIESGDFTQQGDVTPNLGVIYYYNSVYEYDNTTTDADPGAGKFRLDSTTLSSVTEAYFADDNKQGVNQSSILQALPVGTKIILGNPNVKLESALFTVSGAATNNSGYTTVPLTYIDAGTSQLTNGAYISFTVDASSSDKTFGITYDYDSTTTDADPGAGNFRYNNASPASATIIYVADDDKSGVDNSAYLQSLNIGDFIKIGDLEDTTAANSFTVSGAITNATGYSKIPVTHIDAGAGSVTNGNEMSFVIDLKAGDLLYDTSPQLGGILDSNDNQIRESKGADVASAGALTLGTDGNYFVITGTTTITSIGTLAIGTQVTLQFAAALTLTHHATDLILPGGANITTAAGDIAIFREYAAGDWKCVSYTKADGTAVVSSGGGGGDVFGETTTNTHVDTDTIAASEWDEGGSGNGTCSVTNAFTDTASGTVNITDSASLTAGDKCRLVNKSTNADAIVTWELTNASDSFNYNDNITYITQAPGDAPLTVIFKGSNDFEVS